MVGNLPSPYELFYLPETTGTEDIKITISAINGPYIFIYSGHGIHSSCSTMDGQLYWPQKINNRKTDFITHEQLRTVFFDNPPFITIFNCCSTIGTSDVSGYPDSSFTSMEKLYQLLPSRNSEPYRIIFTTELQH